MTVLRIDGQPADCLPLGDRALHYGDGLFETIAVFYGEPRHWERHLRRLYLGCERLNIPAPSAPVLRAEVDACALASTPKAVLKLIITRGSGGRGYRPPERAEPRLIVSTHPWPDYPAHYTTSGVRVRFCRTPLSVQPHLAGLKHLNRLDQVLARSEWDDPEVAEGLMVDTEGHLISGTQSNLFWAVGGRLYTPSLGRSGIAGTLREALIEAASHLGIPCRMGEFRPKALHQAEELLLTNGIIGIWPIQGIDGVGEFHAPGPITRRLSEAVLGH